MKISITQQSNKTWMATRGNENTLITGAKLYAYLVTRKAAGFTITFTINK